MICQNQVKCTKANGRPCKAKSHAGHTEACTEWATNGPDNTRIYCSQCTTQLKLKATHLPNSQKCLDCGKFAKHKIGTTKDMLCMTCVNKRAETNPDQEIKFANGTVDVYLRGYVEALGKVIDAVAHKMAASGFSSSWKTVGCARYKKLMWCVKHSHGRASVSVAGHNYNSCADCTKRFGAFSSAGMCILCKQRLCSRCRVVSKLRVVDAELCLEESEAIICKKCVAHVDNLSTVEIATQEVLSGRFMLHQRRPLIRLWSFRRRSSRSKRSGSLGYNDRVSGFFRMRSNSDCVMLFDPTELFRGSSARNYSFDSETMSLDSVMTPMRAYDSFDDDDDFGCYPLVPEQVHTMEIADQEQQRQGQELWQQMLDLQLAAEQAYQLTMKTTDAHLRRDAV